MLDNAIYVGPIRLLGHAYNASTAAMSNNNADCRCCSHFDHRIIEQHRMTSNTNGHNVQRQLQQLLCKDEPLTAAATVAVATAARTTTLPPTRASPTIRAARRQRRSHAHSRRDRHAHLRLQLHIVLLLRPFVEVAVHQTPAASRSALASPTILVQTNALCSCCSLVIRWRAARSSTASFATTTTARIVVMCATPTNGRCTSSSSVAVMRTTSSSRTQQPLVVSIMPRNAESIVVVLPSATAAAATHPSKATTTMLSHTLSRDWRNVCCDAVAQLVVLPAVCVSICSAVGLLWSLECIEQFPRFEWRALGSTIIRIWAATATSASPFKPPATSSPARISHISAVRSHQSHTNDEAMDDGDAAAHRPLKKQRASDADSLSNHSSNSRACVSPPSSSSSPPLRVPTPRCHAPSSDVVASKLLPHKRTRRVFIWDLDETLVLFASLYNGAFATQHNLEIATGVQLGEQMMAFLLTMLERHFFFNDLHDSDIDHITQARPFDADSDFDSEADATAQRYLRIRAIYERVRAVDFLTDAQSDWFAIREALVTAIDGFSTGWLAEARGVLELLTHGISESGYENVNLLVTNTQLAPALCKCLIYQLDAFFPIESVYSAVTKRKLHCFEHIVATFGGDNVEFVAVGDGAEEEHVSRVLGIPFHKIESLADLQKLRHDLEAEAHGGPAIGTTMV